VSAATEAESVTAYRDALIRNLPPEECPGVLPGVYAIDGEEYLVEVAPDQSLRIARYADGWEPLCASPVGLGLTLAHRLHESRAAAFAARTRLCARCGAVLTEEGSVSRGYGPRCWKALTGETVFHPVAEYMAD
jgi:hypothetical protein